MSTETVFCCDFCGLEVRHDLGDSPPGWWYGDKDLCPACARRREKCRAALDHELTGLPTNCGRDITIRTEPE